MRRQHVLLSAGAVALLLLLLGRPAGEAIGQAVSAPDGQVVQADDPVAIREGTVVLVESRATPPRLAIFHDGTVSSIIVTSSTVIFVREMTSGREVAASLDQIRRGDAVRVTLKSADEASEIRASYRRVDGLLERLTPQAVALVGGQIVTLAEDASFLVGDHQVPADVLRPGIAVTLRINPQTDEVWEVRTEATPVPRVTPGLLVPPTIEKVSINATDPLGLGSTLVVTMHGNPGGAASFDIVGLETGLPMIESQPGQYTGWRRVRWGDELHQGLVIVWLRFERVAVTRDAGRVTIDGLPPDILGITPAPHSTVLTLRPIIRVWFVDRGPAGVDPYDRRNDLRVLNSALINVLLNPYFPSFRGIESSQRGIDPRIFGAQFIEFTPGWALPAGTSRFDVQIADRAGNTAWAYWRYVLAPIPAPTVRPTPGPTTTPSPAQTTPGSTPTPSPAQTAPGPGSVIRTPAPATSPLPTPTPTATATPGPTPTATRTPQPTPTPTPAPTPTPGRIQRP
jgi:hypothetical protein